MIPGYTGSVDQFRKKKKKANAPYPEFDDDMLAISSYTNGNTFPGGIVKPHIRKNLMQSSIHMQMEKVAELSGWDDKLKTGWQKNMTKTEFHST